MTTTTATKVSSYLNSSEWDQNGGGDNDNDNDNANDNDNDGPVNAKTGRRAHQTVKKQCQRIIKAWQQQQENVRKGFAHHLEPLIATPAGDVDGEAKAEIITAVKATQERQTYEKSIAEEYVKLVDGKSFVAEINTVSDDEDEETKLNANMDRLVLNHCPLGDVEADIGGAVDRLENVLLGLGGECVLCKTTISNNEETIPCDRCGSVFHTQCGVLSVTTDPGFVATRCRACNFIGCKFSDYCCICHRGDPGRRTRCGANHCPMMIHLACSMTQAAAKNLPVDQGNLCPVHCTQL